MHILITGATGLIGRHLCPELNKEHQLTVLTRNPANATKLLGENINATDSLEEVDFNNLDCVINLAGEPIVNKRWSEKQKQILRDSRITITQQISAAINQCDTPPHTFISGSAVGFYGRQSTTVIDESFVDVTPEFSHQLCHDWEQAALQAESINTRVCLLRTGIVLANNGGALAKMLPPFKLALGGPIADGQQGMSWIHIEDMINLIIHIINNVQLSGAINMTAPTSVSNSEFSQSLGKVLNRPAKITMPAWVLKLVMGEMADLLLYGQYVQPTKALESSYCFRYKTLDTALTNLLK
ncbi:TIGR01777 family oxidoreductase [Pseudoalteromonas sp. SG44-8]|uniref:TIGR01777 family oxidoreductase n=1 Tax=Pseudoalteromonas sp. SG44-8 TaxID=2760958 RepID=UPI0015FF72F8|nr:TIGR01777 family oxidoreductase [Pseudoalteromonas sp. SG44-8]MBB1397507.1 TIGR01777 family protein [Pseudoalteromonas sp. SG44-8]